jgi:hypothetical protein
MRFAVPALLMLAAVARGQERFVERTPLPRKPAAHTMQRSGDSRMVAPWAVPSLGRFDSGGYVGGGSIRGNKGTTIATGPLTEGTYGTDFAGFHLRMGRVFLAPSADPACGPSIAQNYRTTGPHVPDVFAIRPFRRAVLEKKEGHHD